MRLTRAGEYGVRCVLYLTSKGGEGVVSRNEIAGKMDIPAQLLTKIAQQLARAGILEVVQGARGGLRLIADPTQITLLEVVEIFTGEIYLNDCVARPESCPRNLTCSVHKVWGRARDQLRDTLRQSTFASLAEEQKNVSDFTCSGAP